LPNDKKMEKGTRYKAQGTRKVQGTRLQGRYKGKAYKKDPRNKKGKTPKHQLRSLGIEVMRVFVCSVGAQVHLGLFVGKRFSDTAERRIGNT
jgi:hypothetical protein